MPFIRHPMYLCLDASRIHLLARDLRDVQPGFLEGALPGGKTPKVLITFIQSSLVVASGVKEL